MKIDATQLLLLLEHLWAFSINNELFDFTLNDENDYGEFLTVGGDGNTEIHDFRLEGLNLNPEINGSELTLWNTRGEEVEMTVLYAPNIEDFLEDL